MIVGILMFIIGATFRPTGHIVLQRDKQGNILLDEKGRPIGYEDYIKERRHTTLPFDTTVVFGVAMMILGTILVVKRNNNRK